MRAWTRLFLLFPDPWPKARHAKRRFVHPALLPEIARVLRPGAEWRVATDDPTHQAWVEEVFAAQALFAAPPPGDAAPGRLAADALRGEGARGRPPAALLDAAPRRLRRCVGRKRDAERLGETALPRRGDGDGARAGPARDPVQREQPRAQRAAHRAGDVPAPLAPVEAGAAERAARGARPRHRHAELGQEALRRVP